MAYQTQKHPDEIIAAVVRAADRGERISEVVRQLAAGLLPEWPDAYEMPPDTARYHVREARKARGAKDLSPQLEQGLGAAIYGLAGRVYTELERKLEAAQKQQKVTVDLLEDVAKTLKTLEGLAKHRPVGKAQTDQLNPVPNDPILARAQELDA